MGSSVSVHRSSAMKLGGSITVAEISSSKLQSTAIPHVTNFHDSSSKEEIFFESHVWLESDCEDFLSVDGDFTPSCTDSPIRQNSFIETRKIDKPLSLDKTADSIPEPSPTDKKKKLVELFRDGFGKDPVDGDKKSRSNDSIMANGKREAKPTRFCLPLMSANKSPYASVHIDAKPEKEKEAHPVQCCLPSLVRNLSFSDRKKRLSSAHRNAGKSSSSFSVERCKDIRQAKSV